ncbi:MAG: transcriptional regulator [Deltaproteobacteria bacterium HGW-Deltaproteobacteria-18]|jgi:Rha family phage regulatory protein|nr:MAG: transcriptional regulator [Deltaproteobacteria bacterium HGW-Deltaproteobacteria-18]
MSESTTQIPSTRTADLNNPTLSNIVINHNDVPMTTSLKVAEVFGKRHDHVLRDIENLIERGVPNFGETSYTHSQNGQSYRMYLMDRKGFTLLAMGFTGDAALQWKSKYIDQFDKMEQHIRGNMPKFAVPQTMIEAMELALTTMKENEKLHAQNAIMAPKADVYDAIVADKMMKVHQFARSLNGTNSRQTKWDLWRAGYLYRQRSGYRVYSKYRDKYFMEKIDPSTGKTDIYVTDAGKREIAKLYNRGILTMKGA